MKRITLLIVFAFFAAPTAHSQDAGRIGIYVDAQFLPQAGLAWHPSDRFQVRAAAYFEGDPDVVADVAVLLRHRIDDELSTYVGPDITWNSFAEDVSVGLLAGTDIALHPRLRLFGEIGVSYREQGRLNMMNTGAGVVFYLNR